MDANGDGLRDDAEVNTHRTNPALADTDRDGLTDGQEITLNLNPLSDSCELADTDGDTLINQTEILLGANPNVVDTDGDGADDAAEIGAGSNPGNTQDTPDNRTEIRVLVQVSNEWYDYMDPPANMFAKISSNGKTVAVAYGAWSSASGYVYIPIGGQAAFSKRQFLRILPSW